MLLKIVYLLVRRILGRAVLLVLRHENADPAAARRPGPARAVSELTGLSCGDVTLGHGASVRCLGKGRKHRAVPLTTPTQAVLWAVAFPGSVDTSRSGFL